jgi:hypothetical protein
VFRFRAGNQHLKSVRWLPRCHGKSNAIVRGAYDHPQLRDFRGLGQ